MFLSIIWWILRLSIVAIIVGILSVQEGLSEIEWIGWKISISTSFLIGLIFFIILLSIWFNNIWNLIIDTPNKILSALRDKRQQDGYKALAYGLFASSAGDIEGTKKYALKAHKLLKNPDLTEMLSAHAAHLAGDKIAAKNYFNNLSTRDSTEFHGHLGLMRLAIEEFDHEKALLHARKSAILQPRNPKIFALLVKMEARSNNFIEAYKALQSGRRIGSFSEKRAAKLSSSLQTAIGFSELEKNNINDAQKFFTSALRENNNFLPAALNLSKIFIGQGYKSKALKFLKNIWNSNPHPDIIKALKLVWEEKRASGVVSKFIDITNDKIGSQARLLIADEALSAGLIGEASDQLNKISEDEYDSYYFHLKSRIADINDDKVSSSKALEQAFDAPRKFNWNCSSCGTSSKNWEINCQSCEEVGTIDWQAPPDTIKIQN